VSEQTADVVAIVSPDTGAREVTILDPGNEAVSLPVAMYQAEKFNAVGVKAAEPAILYRFRPTLAQRARIIAGEDLFLLMLLPNGRSPLPVELTVGPGPLQLEERAPSPILDPLGRPAGSGPQLWTPDQGEPG
jgi:hypothetical protein